MKFTVEIELGNDAMREGPHVAQALNEIANIIRFEDDLTRPTGSKYGIANRDGAIRDGFGNKVGKWGCEGEYDDA